MPRTQKIRSVLFYLSVLVFLVGLPIILSFAFGYKFNPRTFKFTKTGLIFLKTQPNGADIYLNGKLLNEKTPATIYELLPGNYNIKFELKECYPWIGELTVETGKVTRLDKVILFPLRPDIKQLNKDKIVSFWVDEERQKVYYINFDESIIYRSDLDGEHFEECGILPEIDSKSCKWKVSADREKLLTFNPHQITVIYFESRKDIFYLESPILLNYSDTNIVDIFWHSDSYHLIVVTNKAIEVLEANPQAAPVSLVSLNKRNASCSYDTKTDTLYFLDSVKAPDGKFYDNVYKLELSAKSYPFQKSIKPEPNE